MSSRRAKLHADDFAWNGTLAVIGASAGGVEALMTVVEGLPAACPAMCPRPDRPRSKRPPRAARRP